MGTAAESLIGATAPGPGAWVTVTGPNAPLQYGISIQANSSPNFVLLIEAQVNGVPNPVIRYTAPGDYNLIAAANPGRGGAQTPPVMYSSLRANLESISPNYEAALATFTGQIRTGGTFALDPSTLVGVPLAIGMSIACAPGGSAGMVVITGGSGLSWTVSPSTVTWADQALFSFYPPSVSVQFGGGP